MRARLRAARHDPACPAAPAFIPLWAVGVSRPNTDTTTMPRREWAAVFHPPAVCRYGPCTETVVYGWRSNRPKRGPHVYCSAAHKDAAGHPPPKDRGPKGPALTPGICPRPDKHAFDTAEECAARMHTVLALDNTLQVYQCRCWKWHVGHPVVDPGQTIAAIARIIITNPSEEDPA